MYVLVFENKERSSANGSVEWYMGLKEVEVFGKPAAEIGILSFQLQPTASLLAVQPR